MLQLIPISDANPTKRFPVITVVLIALNIVFFFRTPGLGIDQRATVYFIDNAPIPCQLQEECPAEVPGTPFDIPERDLGSFLLATIFSTFLHAGFLHIGGNMLFLWVFGNNIEDHLGRFKFLIFYLLGGIAASFAHVLTHIDSTLPAVGASGAVAAVMGGYLLLYPKARVNVLVFIFFLVTVVQLSAFVVLGFWFVYQFLIGSQELSGATEVAWMAHVGGFVFGLVAVFLLGGRPQRAPAMWSPDWRY